MVDSPRDLVRAGVTELLRASGSLVVVRAGDPSERTLTAGTEYDVVVVDLLDDAGVDRHRLAALRESGLPLVGLVPTHPGDLEVRAGTLPLTSLVPVDASSAVLVDAIERASRSGGDRGPAAPGATIGPATTFGLSGRERAVVDLMVAGRTNAEIAEALGVSVNTVKTNIKGLFRKLGVQRRSQVVALVLRRWPGTGQEAVDGQPPHGPVAPPDTGA